MTQETQMHLLLQSELVFALRANDPETFKRWLAVGPPDLEQQTTAGGDGAGPPGGQ